MLRRPLLFLLPLTLALPLPSCSFGQATPAASLLALSKQDHTLAIVDPADLRVLARIPVGDDPHEVTASADGLTAYVSNYGFGAFHTLTMIDLAGQKPKGVIDLGALRGPHGLFFTQDKVWFTAEAAKAIGSYDPAAGKIDWIMGTGQNRTHMLYVFPDAKKILTTNVNSATVSMLEKTERPAGLPPGPPPGQAGGAPPEMPPGPPPAPPGGDWNETVIAVGRGSEGFDVSPDGKEAWVANAQDGTVSVIDIANKRVTATLDANARGANRLKFTPDGKLVLITPGSALVIYDAATRKEVKRLPSVHGSGGIQMQPDGARAYVACGRDGYVAVIDLKTLEPVGKIEVASPDGLAWAVR
ncbi:MAG TPA: cytochrome D1 domain-containing protein [Terracidiphilus sp.]|jgi:YVTN family beta-propeller protein